MLYFLKNRLQNAKYAIEKKIKLRSSQRYQIGPYSIDLPAHHPLAFTCKEHPFYDCFLPILTAELPKGTIVDVGANVGDTAISMARHTSNTIIAIEGSQKFFDLLCKNVKKNNLQNQILCINQLIGSGDFKGELQVHEGTGVLKKSAHTTKLTSLDSILENIHDVVLIKTDTDGFDYNILSSAYQTINKSLPLVFWENELREDYDLESYQNLYRDLSEKGYQEFYLFDNFGQLICKTNSLKVVEDFNLYFLNQKKHLKHRTIYYLDILAVSEKNSQYAASAIKNYMASMGTLAIKRGDLA